MLRAFDAWNSTLLVITCHNEDESFQRNCCLSSACQWIQIQRNDKCPLQVECGKIHQFSNINCMSLYKVHRVFISILLFRLVYLLPVTIQAPLGSESLGTNLTRKVLMIFFMLKKQPIVHESLWFFFASSLHTHPAYTSDNMHSPYVVLQIGLCHCSKLALLASKLLFWLFSRMVFFMVEQSCSCLQRLIACLANELLPPFLQLQK